MSDNDTTEDTSTNVDEVEFSTNPFGDDEDTTTTAPSEETTDTSTKPAEDNAEKTDETTEEVATDEAKPTEEPEAAEATPEEQSNDVDLKSMSKEERKEYFQSLQQNQKRQVEQAINEVYQPQPVDQLKDEFLNEGYSEYEATMLARDTVREQATQIAEARAEIAEVNMAIQTDAIDVMSTFDWADPSKPTFDKETASAAGQLYEQLGVTKDPRTGQIIEAKIPLKQFYNAINTIRNSGSTQAQIKAQKAAEAQMAAAAPPTSTAPPAANASADDKQASSLERALNNA